MTRRRFQIRRAEDRSRYTTSPFTHAFAAVGLVCVAMMALPLWFLLVAWIAERWKALAVWLGW